MFFCQVGLVRFIGQVNLVSWFPVGFLARLALDKCTGFYVLDVLPASHLAMSKQSVELIALRPIMEDHL